MRVNKKFTKIVNTWYKHFIAMEVSSNRFLALRQECIGWALHQPAPEWE
jgi:hypothetical protein